MARPLAARARAVLAVAATLLCSAAAAPAASAAAFATKLDALPETGPALSPALLEELTAPVAAGLVTPHALRLAALRTRRTLRKVRRSLAALREGLFPEDIVHGPRSPPSTLNCRVFGSVFELCQYENLCVNFGRPPFIQNHGSWFEDRVIYHLGKDANYAGFSMAGAESAKTDTWAESLLHPGLRPLVTSLREAEVNERSFVGVSKTPFKEAPISSATWDIAFASPNSVFGDTTVSQMHGFAPRLQPLALHGMGMASTGGRPTQAQSSYFGGEWNGTVTWLDNLYVVQAVSGDNLAEYSAVALSPLLLAQWYNVTMDLKLPPADNVYVDYQFPTWLNNAWIDAWGWGKWITAALKAVLTQLRGGAPPIAGRHLPVGNQSFPLTRQLSVALSEALSLCCGIDAPVPPEGPWRPPPAALEPSCASTLQTCLTSKASLFPLLATLNDASYAGTRVIFTEQDVPKPPSLEALLANGTDAAWDNRVPYEKHRVCARRAVIGGRLPNYLPSAELERATTRRHAAMHGGAPTVGFGDYGSSPPPLTPGVTHDEATGAPRVLIVDRSKQNEPRGRYFENLYDLLGVCAKYALNCTVVREDVFGKAGYEPQLQMHRTFPIVVAPHGANEASAYTMPRRGVLIEVQPRMMWCASWNKGNGHADLFPLPIHAKWKPYQERFEPGPMRDERMSNIIDTYTRCDGVSMVEMPGNMPCWYPMREIPVRVPVPEFEATLLKALDLVGHRTPPKHATLLAVEGVPVDGAWNDADAFGPASLRKWGLCSPNDTCSAAPTPPPGLVWGSNVTTGANRYTRDGFWW